MPMRKFMCIIFSFIFCAKNLHKKLLVLLLARLRFPQIHLQEFIFKDFKCFCINKLEQCNNNNNGSNVNKKVPKQKKKHRNIPHSLLSLFSFNLFTEILFFHLFDVVAQCRQKN